MKKYELVVFDWDGTLMDSEARIVTCMQRAAEATGYERPQDHAVREIIGLSLETAVERLFAESDATGVERITEAYRNHWLGDDVPQSVMFADAGRVLDTLLEHGYLLAIATGKSRRGLDKVLQETGLGEHFHASRCADEAFSKPHPQMLEDILTDLNTEPSRALLIGDTEYDMQMAGSAGVDALGVVHGVHTPERLLQNGALGVLSNLAELPPWLGKEAEKAS